MITALTKYENDLAVTGANVEHAINATSYFANQGYLLNLTNAEILPCQLDSLESNRIRMIQVDKFVYNKEENLNDKWISVFGALSDVESSAFLLINSKDSKISFYIGVTSDNASTAISILEKSFHGNFPGSSTQKLKKTQIEGLLNEVTRPTYEEIPKNISCVTVVPSTRDTDKDRYVQGLEKFVDSMQGSDFSTLIIAHPLDKVSLQERKKGYENLHTALSPYAKQSFSYSENKGTSHTDGTNKSFSETISKSISKSLGHSYKAFLFRPQTSVNDSFTQGESSTSSEGTSTSDTTSKGASKSISFDSQNKAVNDVLDQLEGLIDRINGCESFGVWECAAYFIADDIQTSVVAASTYKALMLGEQTNTCKAYMNVWQSQDSSKASKVIDYLRLGHHPMFSVAAYEDAAPQIVTPGTFVSGKELPLMLGLPHKSVPGFSVLSMADFGRNVYSDCSHLQNAPKIGIGNIQHMGVVEDTAVNLDLNSFTSHCFITGSTGSGKSNTTYNLISRFIRNNIPFLIIEPAKGEYKEAFGGVEGINIYTTNPQIASLLKLNPFKFPAEIHILEHLDRLIEIFNACWEMYAAMPAILKAAIEQIYIEKGWDLESSTYIYGSVPQYPSFSDLLISLPKVIKASSYSSDTQGDYTGALVTRVQSLANGISGQIFCDLYDIPDEVLFNENTIVDLSRIGSTETKALLMGILVLRLTEFRIAKASGANSGLRHVTVLEEAHNLLKRSNGSSNSGSSVVSKSVEMICNSIAEMRTYGEGFIIVDQSPTAVDIAAIKNTNTKIVMRLPEKSDCESVALSCGLNEEQTKELSRLETGSAIIMQNNWLEAVMVKVYKYDNTHSADIEYTSIEQDRVIRGLIVKKFIDQFFGKKGMDCSVIHGLIDNCKASLGKKKEWKKYISAVYSHLADKEDFDFACNTLASLSGANGLLPIIENRLMPDKEGYSSESVQEWKSAFADLLKKRIEIPMQYIEYAIPRIIHKRRDSKIDYSLVIKELRKA